jgi:hypothetical protein
LSTVVNAASTAVGTTAPVYWPTVPDSAAWARPRHASRRRAWSRTSRSAFSALHAAVAAWIHCAP